MKFVPQLLTDEQKQQCMFVCQEFDEVRNNQNFLSRIITGDGNRIYCYDPETSSSIHLSGKAHLLHIQRNLGKVSRT